MRLLTEKLGKVVQCLVIPVKVVCLQGGKRGKCSESHFLPAEAKETYHSRTDQSYYIYKNKYFTLFFPQIYCSVNYNIRSCKGMAYKIQHFNNRDKPTVVFDVTVVNVF